MDKIKTIKRLLFIYKIIFILSPIIFLFFDFLNTEIKKRVFVKSHGYLKEEFFVDGVGVVYIIIGCLILILIPFFIWIHFLNKKIKDRMTPIQLTQMLIITIFPTLTLLIVETIIIVRIIMDSYLLIN